MTFRGYRFEPLVLALVAFAALPPISLAGPQDRTRYELTRHIVLFHTLTLGRRRWPCRLARFAHALKFRQALSHALKRRFTIGRLRAALGCGDRDPAWPMRQAHASLDFIAMLTAGAARDEKFHVAIALKRFTVCSISGHNFTQIIS